MPQMSLRKHYDPGQNWQIRFWSVFIGQGFSLIGGTLTQFILLWWVTNATSNAAALALVNMFGFAPYALLGPFSGALADRYSRRGIMIITGLGRTACTAAMMALFLTSHAELQYLYIVVFIRSSLQVFQLPAITASLPMLVPASFLSRSAGFSQALLGVSMVAAAPLGALTLSLLPVGYALGIDLAAVLLGLMPLAAYPIPQMEEPVKSTWSLGSELRKGAQIVWNDRGLRDLYGLLTATVLVISPPSIFVMLLVKVHFGGGPPQAALIGSAGGTGMILGGVLVAAISPAKPIPWMLGSPVVCCVMVALTALTPANMFWLGASCWMLSNIAFAASTALRAAFVQSKIPNHLQARVSAWLTTIMAFTAPVGFAIATPLEKLIGVRWLFVVLGFAGAVIALFGFLSQAIRSMETRQFMDETTQNIVTK
jgi:MFS transporter, DHA3 family, macrolide efflux protein